MSIGLAYEGDGYIRSGPAGVAMKARPDEAVSAQSAAAETGATDASLNIAEMDQRARALRREYLNAWLCRLLDRWS